MVHSLPASVAERPTQTPAKIPIKHRENSNICASIFSLVDTSNSTTKSRSHGDYRTAPKPHEIEQMFRRSDMGNVPYCGGSSFHARKCKSGGISPESSTRTAPERIPGRRLLTETGIKSQLAIAFLWHE
jgi:hypothetical protein